MTDSATRPQQPRSLRVALVAIGAQVVLTLVTALLLWGYTSARSQQLVEANNKLKVGGKPARKVPYTSAQVAHDLHQLRVEYSFQAVIVCALIALAAVKLRRGSGMARWLYIAASVVFSVLGGIGSLDASGPKFPNLVSFMAAVVAMIGIVSLIVPDSARFFAATRALRMPPPSPRGGTPATAGGGRPAPRPLGLRGLFAPPPPRTARVDASTNSAANTATNGAANGAAQSGGKANRVATGALRKPATTRPGSRAGDPSPPEVSSTRGKPKVRSAGVDASAPGQPEMPTTTSAATTSAGNSSAGNRLPAPVSTGTSGARPRGKSRRV